MLRFLWPVLILFSQLAKADISIIDVRKNIPLSDDDPSFTDFYISAGENEGLKKNMVVTAFRNMNIRDASGAQSFGEISIPVGQVKILAVYQKLAVAREYKLLPRDINPMLEQIGLMSGDRIELANSFVDNSTPKRKPQTVAISPAVVKPAVTVTPTAEPAPLTVTTVTATSVTTQKEPLVLPGEVTKIAQDDSSGESVPKALLEESPVNNTATEPLNSEAEPITQ